jgi:hypothetical protein
MFPLLLFPILRGSISVVKTLKNLRYICMKHYDISCMYTYEM